MGVLIGNVARKERRDTAANWTSNNPTPLDGEWCLETDSKRWKVGDGVTAWTSLKYFKATAFDSLPQTYDISAADTVLALPAIDGTQQRIRAYWINGDGSNTFTMSVSDAATVGGLAVGTWVGDGTGFIDLESDGTSDWKVVGYEDSGSNANGNFKKDGDGHLRCFGQTDQTGWTVLNGNTYYKTITLPAVAINTSYVPSGSVEWPSAAWARYYEGSYTKTTTNYIAMQNSGGIGVIRLDWSIIGRWRT